MLSGFLVGLIPGLVAVAIFFIIGVPMLIVAATLAIHIRRRLREMKKARARAARLAAKAAARRKAPSSRERQPSPQLPVRATPRRARVMSLQPLSPAMADANGEGP